MTINCAGRLVSLEKPLVMGIVNLTPDSFFAPSRNQSADTALRNAEIMLAQGAEILDLGGYSTRPGAPDIGVEEEKGRVIPAVSALAREFPDAVISIDTFRADVALSAVGEGASMINDVSAGLLDKAMLETVANLRVPYIMMHMRGNPQTMSAQTHYEDIIGEMLQYFSERIAVARTFGIAGLPILAGLSRKSMIRSVTGTNADDALNGTTALHMAALLNGARILRVHDVPEAVECTKLYEKLRSATA